ncbi:MAG: hypothetical protein ACRD3Q_03285 [Terriglobales bacterium]
MSDDRSFASTSLSRHLARGAVGLIALTAAVVLVPVFWPGSLLLAPVGLLALRGCPTCWMIGLTQTISLGRLRRSCDEGRCRLTAAGHA